MTRSRCACSHATPSRPACAVPRLRPRGRCPHLRHLRRPVARRRVGAQRGPRRSTWPASRPSRAARRSTRSCARPSARGSAACSSSWEPWKPVPAELGVAGAVPRRSPATATATSRAAAQDEYILALRAQPRDFQGRVDLRYAHEMNGTWYPWSHDPIAYRRAWRHVVAAVPLGGRAQRALRVVAQPASTFAGAGGAACASTGRAPLCRRGGLDDDQLRRRQALSGARGSCRACGRCGSMYRKPVHAHRGQHRLPRPRPLAQGSPADAAAHAVDPLGRVVPAPQPRPGEIKGAGRLDWDVQPDPAAAACCAASSPTEP